jgi:hypothetical protein
MAGLLPKARDRDDRRNSNALRALERVCLPDFGARACAKIRRQRATARSQFQRGRTPSYQYERLMDFLPAGSSGRARGSGPQAGQITSLVCPKQYLAPCIKAAFSRNITLIKVASIFERAVPTASLPPFRPFEVIAILAVGISRLLGRTKDALGGVYWTGDYVPRRSPAPPA